MTILPIGLTAGVLTVSPHMKGVKLIILFLLSTVNTIAQDWHKQISDQVNLVAKIQNHESWESVYEFGQNDLNISEESLVDIAESIEFQTKPTLTSVDTFFHRICDSVYARFPYRQSGHLSKALYFVPPPDTSRIGIIIRGFEGKDLHTEFAKLLQTDENKLLRQLIQYLKNDAATRLCIRPIDWDESPFYLSISDIAMELLEVKTYCDFFDNASHSQKLFSNLSETEKEKVIKNVEKWVEFRNGKTQFQKIEYFLDSLSDIGHSYRYTCHNLLFIGDTIGAKKMYAKFYESTEIPCTQDFNVGEILLELGDRRVLYDCSDKIFNYKCIVDGLGRNCVEMFFNSDEAWFRDDVFAEIIATEPHSNYRNGDRRKFIWHYIFGMIPDTDRKLLKTLVELMGIQDTTNSLNNQFTDSWKNNYPNEFELNYRVCDFALVKYLETIKEETKLNYGSIDEKKKLNQILDEMDTLHIDIVDDRNKMIEIIKKYED